MRLDFNTFVITGPTTQTVSTFKFNGKEANQATSCATDLFKVTNAQNLPELCGTLTGEHGWFESTYDFASMQS